MATSSLSIYHSDVLHKGDMRMMTASQLKANMELWMKNNPSKSSPVALVELASAMTLNELEALNEVEAIRKKYQIPFDIWK